MATEDDLAIHPQWVAWVAENLARGASLDDVVAGLIKEGVPDDRARVCAEEIAASPAMQQARQLWRRADALERMVRLRHEHRSAQATGHDEIVRRTLPGVDEFLAQYWVPGVPAIFTDLVTKWPAFSRWSPAYFAERFAGVTLEACVGRNAIDDPDPEWADVKRDLTMGELVELVEAPGAGNDVYVIAKNTALRRSELSPLLDDIDLPEGLFGKTLEPKRMGLWFGPAGTHTPMHHDGDNSMFCQVVGRKRFRLAAPDTLELLDYSRGVYSQWDPQTEAELKDGPTRLIEIELQAGEALFIPAGWWHQVDSLDVSISVSILEWAFPNDFSWYKPGTALRGRPT